MYTKIVQVITMWVCVKVRIHTNFVMNIVTGKVKFTIRKLCQMSSFCVSLQNITKKLRMRHSRAVSVYVSNAMVKDTFVIRLHFHGVMYFNHMCNIYVLLI